jgi:hypothetical protein
MAQLVMLQPACQSASLSPRLVRFTTKGGSLVSTWGPGPSARPEGWQRTPRSARVGKTDLFRQGHQSRLGVPWDPRVHVDEQLLAFLRAVGNGPRAGCTKRAEQQCPCPVCPPLFFRSADRGRSFDLSLLPTAQSAAVVRALGHMGYNTAPFSGISARHCGLSMAIEAGVPEAILWMQSGHAQDIQLGSPKILYRTWDAFRL